LSSEIIALFVMENFIKCRTTI